MSGLHYEIFLWEVTETINYLKNLGKFQVKSSVTKLGYGSNAQQLLVAKMPLSRGWGLGPRLSGVRARAH